MTLGTSVFRRIMDDHKKAAINAVKETMKETVRFGNFNDSYIEGCAKDRFEDNLKAVQSL